MSIEITRIATPNPNGVHAVSRVQAAVPPPEPSRHADTSAGDQGSHAPHQHQQKGHAPGPGYVLMQRFLVAADNIQGAHVKFPPNPVQLSLGLLTGSRTGVVMLDVDGDGISIEPPTRLDRRA